MGLRARRSWYDEPPSPSILVRWASEPVDLGAMSLRGDRRIHLFPFAGLGGPSHNDSSSRKRQPASSPHLIRGRAVSNGPVSRFPRRRGKWRESRPFSFQNRGRWGSLNLARNSRLLHHWHETVPGRIVRRRRGEIRVHPSSGPFDPLPAGFSDSNPLYARARKGQYF